MLLYWNFNSVCHFKCNNLYLIQVSLVFHKFWNQTAKRIPNKNGFWEVKRSISLATQAAGVCTFCVLTYAESTSICRSQSSWIYSITIKYLALAPKPKSLTILPPKRHELMNSRKNDIWFKIDLSMYVAM